LDELYFDQLKNVDDGSICFGQLPYICKKNKKLQNNNTIILRIDRSQYKLCKVFERRQ